LDIFEIFRHEFITFGLSLLPVSEIRGAVIYGLSAMGKDLSAIIQIYIISVIGNFLPVPVILWLFRPLLKKLKKTKLLRRH